MRYTDLDGMWSTDSWGNQFTTDFGDISAFLNQVVNPALQSQQRQNLEPTYVANSANPFIDSQDENEEDPPKKKKINSIRRPDTDGYLTLSEANNWYKWSRRHIKCRFK